MPNTLLSALPLPLWLPAWYRYRTRSLREPARQRHNTTLPSSDSGNGAGLRVEYKVTDPLKLVFDAVPLKVFNAFWYGYVVVDRILNWSCHCGNLLFWTALAFALVGLVGRHISSRALVVLGVLAATGFLFVWIVAFETKTYDPRLALAGMPALACLAALGLERWKVRIASSSRWSARGHARRDSAKSGSLVRILLLCGHVTHHR